MFFKHLEIQVHENIMRIGVNTRFLLKGKMEGMAVFTAQVMQRIVNDHPEHEFYFFFDRAYDESFVFAENVTPVVVFPQARHPFLFIWWYEFSLPHAFKDYKIDLFLSPDNFTSLWTEIPTLLVVHDIAYEHFPAHVSSIQYWYYATFMKRFVKKADRIVTVSEFTKRDLMENLGAEPQKIAVGCNGCDARFKAISEKEKEEIRQKFTDGIPYFVFVGLIHPRKNVPRLIQAFSQFKEKTGADTKLVLVGRNGWKNKEVSATLKSSDYASDVIFTGFVEEDELPKLIASALALTYVSLFEGFGIPILEAFYCETPVITSFSSSMPEVGGNAVLYVDPNSIDSIAEQLERLYLNPSLQQEMIKRGKIQRTKFSWERAAQTVYSQIESIAEENDLL